MKYLCNVQTSNVFICTYQLFICLPDCVLNHILLDQINQMLHSVQQLLNQPKFKCRVHPQIFFFFFKQVISFFSTIYFQHWSKYLDFYYINNTIFLNSTDLNESQINERNLGKFSVRKFHYLHCRAGCPNASIVSITSAK